MASLNFKHLRYFLQVADTGAAQLIGAQAGQTLAGCFRGQ